MAVANPPPLVPIAGARDREGRSRRNRHHWIAPSRGINHHPHRLVLDHRGAPRLQLCAFLRKSTVQQCKTDPGRRRERSGACVRAVPMGQGVGRVWRPPAAPRVERARPFSDEFWRFGPDKGTSIILVARQERLARRRRSDRGRALRVRVTPRPRTISHACVCACDTGACNHRCSSGGALRRRESSRERRGGDGAAPRAAAAATGWASARGRRPTAATCMAQCLARSGEKQARPGWAREAGGSGTALRGA